MVAGALLGLAAGPALLAGRLATGRWWAGAAAAVASAVVPWLLLAPLGTREALAYLAFLWAFLAIYRAVAAPSLAADALALAAIAPAALAHGLLLVLLVVLPLAVLVQERTLRRHPLLVGVYAALVVAAALALSGLVELGWHWQVVRELGSWAVVPGVAGHLESLALLVAIAPLLVAAAWLAARAGRDAFASVVVVTLLSLLLGAAALDGRFGYGVLNERNLLYAVPVVLLAAVAALVPWRRPAWSPLAAVLAALGLGLGVSRITGRVNDWFVMTDELLYERLAISIARTGSPLPRIHGETIESYNQLYPLLLSTVYRSGLVPESLYHAHVLNAFVMASVVVPVYLLARSATGRSGVALGVGVLSALVPWLTLSSFLLTEVVAYPVFAWALFAVYRAVASPRPLNDALALAAIAAAAFARVQFLILLLVLPVAVVLLERRRAVARHRLLAVAYGAFGVAAAALAATGGLARVLGTYAQTAEGIFPPGLPRAFAEHAAELSLAVAILPFLVAAAWLLANALRDPFAAVGTVTLLAVTLQVASFNERFGDQIVRDRYLFYVVPIVLVGLACALTRPGWPRWSLVAPTLVVGAGFALYGFPRFEKLHADAPVAVLHDPIVELGGSVGGARLGLVLATLVLVLAFVEASVFVRRSAVAVAVAALVVVALPGGTAYAFSRLFAVPGTSGRELTHDQAGVFNWVDRALGPEAEVTMVPYPHLEGDYWATVAYWWDLEFWNKSVVSAASRDEHEFHGTPGTFPKLRLAWDERGRLDVSPTRYVTQLVRDSRFRIAGELVWHERETDLIDAGEEWRLAWASDGLYEDGWTRPDRDATVTVFPEPGQDGPVTRFLTLVIPPAGEERVVDVDAGGGRTREILRGEPLQLRVPVCIRPGRPGIVGIGVLGAGPIVGNPVNIPAYAQPRVGGVRLQQIALAEETEAGCRAQP